MTQVFQKFTQRYLSILGVLIGLAVVSSILIYSGCGMTSRPNIPTNPTPTPDITPPTSTITSPTSGATVLAGVAVNITGTASDTGGGSVARVEVSVDGGVTFSATTGTNAWSFDWTPTTPGPVAIKSRAVDNTGNVQNPPAEIAVTVRDSITIRVPSDRPTIQSAIDFAIDGDTVLVAPGTYRETINFRGKAITVKSDSGRPQDTIIDGESFNNTIVRFTSGEGRDSVLNGFTLQNGSGNGITVQGSSPTITNNVIKNNSACNGGGIGISNGSPLIQLNTITGNGLSAGLSCVFGGGISITGASSAEILDNVISDNRNPVGLGGGIAIAASGTSIVKRNIIKGNGAGFEGGGIGVQGPALIVQNLIVGNGAGRGAGIALVSGPILVNNNTIADNDAREGSGIRADVFEAKITNNIIVAKPRQTGLYCGDSNPNPSITRFNNIFSSGGMAYGGTCSDKTGTDGNISADPQFTNPTQGDYHLQQVSTSIDVGDNQAPNLPDTDLDGHPRILDGDGNGTAIIDMGAYEFLLPPGSTPPFSTITSPKSGATVSTGTTFSITGLAKDAVGGAVVRVEVSVDGGVTWNLATGTTAWSYDWTPATPGPATIKSRAVDDSGNVQDPPAEITVTVRIPVTIRVPSADQPTIQSAINAASYGDTVLVAPGTYAENIDFRGKAITVRSESGRPEDTIINGGGANPVVSFILGEGRDSVLNGFTLQHGLNNQGGAGGGITVRESSPTITNNVIKNNQACKGGGIGISGGSPFIRLNTITDNDTNICASSAGGGIFIGLETDALIVQNLITGNQASFGGGLYWRVPRDARGLILVNNTIADNNATSDGSGIFVAEYPFFHTELTNNIIVAKPGQSALYFLSFFDQNPPIIRFNNIFSAGGMAYGGVCPDMTGTDGNISAEPMFNNPAQGDYHLQQGSPSIDSGDNQAPNLPDTDIDENPRILDGDGDGTATIDMGVYEFPAPSSALWNFIPRIPRSYTPKISNQKEYVRGFHRLNSEISSGLTLMKEVQPLLVGK